MISERAALGRPGAVRRSDATPALRLRLTARPAVAGRERLADALGGSVLVQLMLAMSFVALAALLYMAQAGQASVQEINISELQYQRMQLVQTNTNLRALATSLRSPQRVDTIATTQLHMGSPDPATIIWLNAVVPPVPAIAPVNADTVAAQQSSQPLAEMERAIRFIRASL